MATQKKTSQLNQPDVFRNREVRIAEGYTRGDMRIINAVDTFLPMAARAITEKDVCLSCSHLIHRNAASICRKATVLGKWPTDRTEIDAPTLCHGYTPEQTIAVRQI